MSKPQDKHDLEAPLSFEQLEDMLNETKTSHTTLDTPLKSPDTFGLTFELETSEEMQSSNKASPTLHSSHTKDKEQESLEFQLENTLDEPLGDLSLEQPSLDLELDMPALEVDNTVDKGANKTTSLGNEKIEKNENLVFQLEDTKKQNTKEDNLNTLHIDEKKAASTSGLTFEEPKEQKAQPVSSAISMPLSFEEEQLQDIDEALPESKHMVLENAALSPASGVLSEETGSLDKKIKTQSDTPQWLTDSEQTAQTADHTLDALAGATLGAGVGAMNDLRHNKYAKEYVGEAHELSEELNENNDTYEKNNSSGGLPPVPPAHSQSLSDKPRKNLKTKIALAVGLVVLLAAGGTAYVVHQNMSERRDNMEQNLAKIKASLPPGVEVSNEVINSGLFSTEGNYTVRFDKNSKNGGSSLITAYTLEHGVSSWFGGDVAFKGDTRLTGQAAKGVRQNADKLIHTEGVLQENGSYNFVSTTPEIVLENAQEKKDAKEQAFVKIMPSTSKVEYSAQSGEVKSNFAFPRLELIKSTDGKVVFRKESDIALQGIALVRNFNVAEPQMGDFTLTVDKAGNEYINVDKVLINSSIGTKQNKYNIKTVFKIDQIKSPMGQANKLEFNTSLSNLDMASTKKFTTVYQEYMKTRELSDKQIVMLREAFMGLASKGFVFSLDKAQGYMDPLKTNGAELSVKFELKPSVLESEVSFSEKSKISASLLVNGPQAATANLMLNSLFSQELVARSSQQFSMVAEYDNKILTVNHRANLSGIDAQINNYLRVADKALGLHYKNEEQSLSSGSEIAEEATKAALAAQNSPSTQAASSSNVSASTNKEPTNSDTAVLPNSAKIQ